MGTLTSQGNAGARLLIVDDDEAVLKATARALDRLGYEITACNRGSEALQALREGTFDAVVSDVRMPEMSGLQLLRAIREHDLDLPVVLMTGEPELKSAAAAVEYGAFQYLIKPVEVERLRLVVERAVSVGRVSRVKRSYVEEFGSSKFRVGDQAGIETTLTRALATIWMAYQPIVKARGEAVFAFEALLRSGEPALPHPSAVLNAAERSHRLYDVGRAVRDRVASDVQGGVPGEALVFVNLHPEDLLDPSLFLPGAPLTAHASRIVLEITERAPLDGISDVPGRIARLRALGFRFALDDLGAGYAGLSSFTLLEPDFVKLDMSLVRNVHESTTKQKLAQSMVTLCHDLGHQVIAEGVETALERDALLETGCDLFQGYFFGRPVRGFGAPEGARVSLAAG